ncbi:MAG: cobalamin B12-binding domain-containing protein [Candidatus Helarchaeota archaeon]|nr:cobalamin B12-binding domain-containing protein [Candidatus Helarchaeota archaeon]
MKSYDVILIHPSRVFDKKRAPNRSLFLLFPMGLLAIADLLDREGISVKIINYPLEQILNKNFSLETFLRTIDFKICGIALHWALHSYGAMEIAKTVKKVNPNAKVILGGFSATYFHDEILKYFKSIDGVIKGEGEVPFLEYCRNTLKNQSIDSVPNLSYKNSSNHVRINPITYIAKTLDELSFSNISLLHNAKRYLALGVDIMRMQFPLSIARGCPYNCPYCGGGQRSQLILTKRESVVFRSPEKVVEDLQCINDAYKAEGVFFGHGSYPGSLKYWKALFSLIQKEKLDLGADLEIWRLPLNKEMWNLYQKTFVPEISSISVCPRSLSPRVQRKIRETCDPSYYFPRNQIEKLIKNAILHQIVLRIWFTVGFPFQTRMDLLKDYYFVLKQALKYGNSKKFPITVLNDLVTVIPASPAFENPERFDISLTFKSFRQTVEMYKRAKFVIGGWNSVINYENKFLSNIEMRVWNRIFNMTEIPMFINSTH